MEYEMETTIQSPGFRVKSLGFKAQGFYASSKGFERLLLGI